MCCSEFGGTHLQTVSLAGVEDAYSQHSDAESKGIKAHFRVDDSGLLHLDKVRHGSHSPGKLLELYVRPGIFGMIS